MSADPESISSGRSFPQWLKSKTDSKWVWSEGCFMLNQIWSQLSRFLINYLRFIVDMFNTRCAVDASSMPFFANETENHSCMSLVVDRTWFQSTWNRHCIYCKSWIRCANNATAHSISLTLMFFSCLIDFFMLAFISHTTFEYSAFDHLNIIFDLAHEVISKIAFISWIIIQTRPLTHPKFSRLFHSIDY